MSAFIKQLENPCSTNYKELQNAIYDPDFLWSYHDPMGFPGEGREKELPYYSHTIMRRPMPGQAYSVITSNLFDLTYKVIEEILNANNIQPKIVYRINFNSTFATNLSQSSWHKDLQFPHTNLIVYMNKFDGGATLVRDKIERPAVGRVEKFSATKEQAYEPKVDDAIIFDGDLEHCHLTPDDGRRITLVVNYL